MAVLLLCVATDCYVILILVRRRRLNGGRASRPHAYLPVCLAVCLSGCLWRASLPTCIFCVTSSSSTALSCVASSTPSWHPYPDGLPPTTTPASHPFGVPHEQQQQQQPFSHAESEDDLLR